MSDCVWEHFQCVQIVTKIFSGRGNSNLAPNIFAFELVSNVLFLGNSGYIISRKDNNNMQWNNTLI